MRKILICCMMLFIILSACSVGDIPEPDYCPICSGPPCHAPCIVNLSTGEMIELSVYDPDPFLAGELAKEQRGGYFSFVHGAGIEGFKLGAESVQVSVPGDAPSMKARFFCRDCRLLLEDYIQIGYVLVDNKDKEHIVVYPVEDGTEFAVRCYQVTVKHTQEKNEYEVFVLGTFELGESIEKAKD